ncbi:DUF1642 domain-containing protein [Carnobacterium maltaromaticum]|uniref:DUF1642 domain-containing protein n=1 Tax=Carnobacterium maltaromaticum TaxID=2751 RepID=UPI0039BDF838
MTTKAEEVLNEMKKCINKVDMYEKAERDIKNLTNLSLDDLVKEIATNGLNVKPEKVKVPKFIADWIETWQGDGRTILHAMSAAEYEVTKYNNPVGKWLTGGRITEHDIKNQMIFVSAWLNGYEVEEEKVNFEVGEYYFADNMVCRVDKTHEHLVQMELYDFEVSDRPVVRIFNDDATCLKGIRKATDEEIKLFKRAEMYHKHGRKLDELRVDDFVKSGNDIYQITQTKGFVESIIDGKHELYLTIEEAQEAHKKIVGE